MNDDTAATTTPDVGAADSTIDDRPATAAQSAFPPTVGARLPAATSAATASLATGSPAATASLATGFDTERRAMEFAVLDALRSVVDPEIGMNVVELALIKQIVLGRDESEIKMILTTPFCPYAGSMIQQVREAAESVTEHPVKVTLLAERWDPRDAGLMW